MRAALFTLFAFLPAFCFSQTISLVKDFGLNASGSTLGTYFYNHLYADVDGKTYFIASGGATDGTGIYATDGTTAGTSQVLSVLWNSAPVAYHGSQYFAIGTKLYKSTHISDTTLVYNFGAPDCIGDARPIFTETAIYNDEIYFTGSDPINGSELWKTDGTTAGTVLVRNLNTYKCSGSPSGIWDGSSSPSLFTLWNDKLLFMTEKFHSNTGATLWQTDGTFAGTDSIISPSHYTVDGGFEGMAYPYHPSPHIMAINNRLYLYAWYYADTFFKIDVTLAQSYALPTSPIAHTTDQVTWFDTFDNKIMYFMGDTLSIMDTNGAITHLGTFPLLAEGGGTGYWLKYVGRLSNGNAYFDISYPGTKHVLYCTNGTPGGTLVMKQFASLMSNVVVYNDSLWFGAADSNSSNSNLWVSDGTRAGSHTIIPSFTANDDPAPNNFFIGNGMLFFWANYNGLNYDLYKIGEYTSAVSTPGNDVSLNVYPNPATGILHVQYGTKAIRHISLVNIAGTEVLSENNCCAGDITLNVSTLPPGTYILSVQTDEQVERRKVVITGAAK